MNYFLSTRHSVRKYLDKPIPLEKRYIIDTNIREINSESGLRIQAIYDEPEAFNGEKPHYGRFSHCKNYFALVGPKFMEEEIGYYGEKLVILCQEIGLNTCWVQTSFRRRKAKIEISKNEEFYLVIAFGYGEDSGVPHKSKSPYEVSNLDSKSPDWFRYGVEAALLAPTGLNRQNFYLQYDGKKVLTRKPTTKIERIDLGIVKYHFELASGKSKKIWDI